MSEGNWRSARGFSSEHARSRHEMWGQAEAGSELDVAETRDEMKRKVCRGERRKRKESKAAVFMALRPVKTEDKAGPEGRIRDCRETSKKKKKRERESMDDRVTRRELAKVLNNPRILLLACSYTIVICSSAGGETVVEDVARRAKTSWLLRRFGFSNALGEKPGITG